MKVLIYERKADLKPVGGPSGYLYNLSIGLNRIKNSEIFFLKDSDKSYSSNNKIKAKLKKIISKKMWFKLLLLKTIKNNIYNDGKEYVKSFENYDAVHFHSTTDLYKNRNLLKKYKGKIILTSHTPEAPYLETCNLLKEINFPNFLIKRISKKLENIDIYSFKRATNLIFPCKEAMGPYLKTFDYFKKEYRNLLKKISFVPTGIINNNPLGKKERKDKKFHVCYIGRHNYIKGYDLLLNAAKKIKNIDKDIEFIIAGNPGFNNQCKNLTNWKELGWINDPIKIEAMEDLFVLPNRETYFDLALLEAISAPSVVLISDTGGNKYFKKFSTKAINFFESGNVNDLIKKILFIKNNYNVKELKEENKIIYKKNFTVEVFARKYIKVLHTIVKK